MALRAIPGTWILAAILSLAFCGMALAADEAKIAAQDDATAAQVRAAVKNYLTLLADGEWEAAAKSCYSANDDQRAASRAWAEIVSEYYACDRLAAKQLRLGEKRSFSMSVPPETVNKAQVLLLNDRAMITINKNVRYPLLFVNGTWRISIEGLAKVEGMSPEKMAAYFQSRVGKFKKLHADLESLDRKMPELEREIATIKQGNAHEAAAVIPTAEQIERAPSDATPAGVLRRYLLYSGRNQTIEQAVGLCYAHGDLSKGLIQATTSYSATEQLLFQAAVFRFGRAAADHLFPRHLSVQAIEQCKIEETGDTARITMPDGSVMPMIKIEGRWKLSLNQFCRLQGKTEAEVFHLNARWAFILGTVTRDLMDGKYDSPEAVIASINARGLAFLPNTLGKDEGDAKMTTTKE